MKKENKRKLNLGDIIRKMNERASSNRDDKENLPVLEKQESAPVKPESINTSSSGNLPPQPSFSKDHSRTPSESYFQENKISAENTNVKVLPEPEQYPLPASANQSPRDFENPTTPSNVPPVNQTQTFESDEEEEFDLFRYLSVIIRRKEIIILATIVMSLFSLYSYLKSTKFYTAKARLLFKPNQESIIDNSPVLYRYGVDRERNFNTHLELLKSNIVLERVAENLNGEIMSGAIFGGLTIKQGKTDGEVNDIIELRFRHTDAEIAQDVLNELCRTYIDYRREVNAQEDTRLTVKLNTQIDKIQNDLTNKENALRVFKENNRMVELSKDANLLTTKLANMEIAFQQTQLDLLESRERLTTLKTQISQQEINVVHSMTYENPMRIRLAELELELNTLSGEYSSDHFKVKQITQQIENLKQAMQTEIENEVTQNAVKHTLVKNPIRESLLQTYVNQNIEISALDAKRTAQEQIIEKLNIEMRELPSLEQEYSFLQRETESLLKTLKMLKMKLEETKIKRDSKESDLKILELAKLPKIAISSKKFSSVFIGIFIGLIIGIALAFLFEYLDQSLKDPSEIEKSLELPLIGIVPLIEAENAIVNNKNLTKSMLEPFRALRANIKHIISQHNCKLFMICSAVKGEGKTTLAINLAITFAMDGKKVILIDCDLRRSQIHTLLNISKKTGIAEYLTSSIKLDEIIKPTVHDNLYVITSGERPDNPSELLGIPKFDTLMKEIKSRADIIICDSPALIPVSDSMIMAPHMDRCIMVVRALWTPIKAAKQAKNQLIRIGAQLSGGILNGISYSRGYYPYYYGYYGYYAYKYSYDYDKEPRKKFTIREFGISIERKIKSVFKSIPLLIPRYSVSGLILLRDILKRSFFWILLILLFTVIGFRLFYFQGTKKASDDGLITYLGGENSSEQQKKLPITIEPGTTEKHDFSETNNAFDENTSEKNSQNQNRESSPQGEIDFAYKDSLVIWMETFNSTNISRFLDFYDAEDFKYPDGGFKEWSAQINSDLLKKDKRDFIITLDAISGENINKNYFKTIANTAFLKGNDTLKVQKTMIWKNEDARWRIIREKSKTINN